MSARKPSTKTPAYQWFPKDAETDEAYRLMTVAQLGIYERLRDHQWLEGSVPDDEGQLVGIVGHQLTLAQFRKLWPGVRRCFTPRADGRLVNERLERQRTTLETFTVEQREHGKRGAAKRWGRHGEANGVAIDSPMGFDSSPVSSLQSPIQTRADARDVSDRRFAEFWKHYPRKKAKAAAIRAWRRLNPSDEFLATMLAVLEWQRKTDDWQKDGGRYIPHPATWLNNMRWEDEPDLSAAPADRINGCFHTPPCRSLTEHTARTEQEAA